MKQFFLSEKNMMIAIIINAVIIFLLYFLRFEHNFWLEVVDQSFILLFLLEAVVKIRVMGAKNYFARGWNRFDFTIVMLSLPSLLIFFLPIPDTFLLIILRLFRLIRLLRFIRFIPNMVQIMSGLGRALKASVSVLMALFFLNFLLAMLTCHFFADTTPQYFGDPLISAYSIFQLFTIEVWNEIPAEISEKLNNELFTWLTRFYFGTVVLIGEIFGISLANAVFVDEMTIDNNRLLE